MRSLTIGELAAEGGVGIETIRFYERKGLLAPPERTAAGYRQYDDEAVGRLRWILRAKELGFTLAEISELLDAGQRTPSGIAEAATAKLVEVDGEVERLRQVRARLESLVGLCVGGDGMACVRLDAAPVVPAGPAGPGGPASGPARSLQDASELLP